MEQGRPLVGGRLLGAMCDHLQAMADGQIKDLVINVPPRCTKSTLVSVVFPAWLWGARARAHERFVSTSYEQTLSLRDNVRMRDLVCSDWYQERWGGEFQLKEDTNQKTLFYTTKGGFRFGTSVGGRLTGFHGDWIVVDDPLPVKGTPNLAQVEEAGRWFAEVLPTRLVDAKQSHRLLVMQRVHVHDPASIAVDRWGWDRLIFPMRYEGANRCRTALGFEDWRTEPGELLWPERFDEAAVAQLERELSEFGGDYAVASQLQQRPVPREGGLFKAGQLRYVDAAPDDIVRSVRGWDLASSTSRTAAWTVGARLGLRRNGRVVVLDVVRMRGRPDEVEAAILGAAQRDGPQVEQSMPIDPGQAGDHQAQYYARQMHGYRVHFSRESGDKEARAFPFAAQVNVGNVDVVRGPWANAYAAEVELFPGGTKDQVDASSRAYARLVETRGGSAVASAPRIPGT